MNLSENFKQTFDFKSLRSRYIYIAISLFIVVCLTVILAESEVNKAAKVYQNEFSDQFIIKNEIEKFISKNETMKSMLLEYLILPERLHYDLLENSIKEYEKSFISLENIVDEINLCKDPEFERVMQELRQDVKPMVESVKSIRKVRNNADKNFPFAKIMVDDLTENNNQFLGAVYEAMSSIEDRNNKIDRQIENRFRDIRYYWVRITTEYRLLVTIRFGVFIGDWEVAYEQIRKNIDQYMNIVNENVKELDKLDQKEILNFESSESLHKIKELIPKSFNSYDSAIDLIESAAWRVDILLWESRVEPGFDKVNSTVNDLRTNLQNYQLKTMSGLSDVSRRLTISLWVIIGTGVVVTIIGYLFFDRKILRPISYVTSAMVEQSEGKDVVIPVHSSTREISDLVESYTEMYKQVKSSKLNLENIVSERTASLEKSNLKLEGTLESLRKTKQSELEAEKANEAKTLFLANMSHEIRTPMNVILGYTQIMQHDTGLSESQRTSLNAIKRSGSHLLMLINNILDISKIEAGKVELNPVDFELKEFIDDLYTMFKVRSDGKKISWNIHYDIDEDVIPVYADEGKLNQVLINLIGNAIKFTDKGGVTLNISKRANDDYLFEVIDTGFGIPEDSLENIFEKFQQEKNGIIKGGTGLGLSISKTQIKEMGGDLKVESEPGKGSRFFFTVNLPVATTDIVHGDEGMKYLPENTRIKALVVDDIFGNRDVLSQLLKMIGLDVIEAQDGESAVVLAEEFKPDIVFMDYHMPGMNGLESLRKLRETIGDDFKAVVVTAHAFDHDVNAYQTADVSMVIKKPFKEEEIIKCISDLMSVDLACAEPSDREGSEVVVVDDAEYYIEGIPDELLGKLYQAVEFSAITDIENIAKKINALGDEYMPFASKLLELANNFDTTSLQDMLKNIDENG